MMVEQNLVPMIRSILSAAFLGPAIMAAAQLAPGTDAPLITHMTEVNAQWRVMDPAPADGARTVGFANDVERIALHLHRVHDHLVAHTPEGLSAAQATNRAFLLERLEAYADAGSFPRNYVLPYRNPIFIDPHGTACAVGQLMIESGHRALAEHIDADMELAYIHQIQLPAVDTWAVEQGFTHDELAWIQPGYLPAITWNSLGGGTDGDVTTTLVLNDGRLLLAGAFTHAGGVEAHNVAIWDGSTFTPLGEGTPNGGLISCAIAYGNDIVLGGTFNGYQDIAIWNGSAWSYQTAFSGKTSQVNALHRHEGQLFAAGSSMGFAGGMYGVAVQESGEWELVGAFFDGEVHALGSHDGKLVAAGAFDGPADNTDPIWRHVAVYNGGWAQLGDGLDAPVFDLLEVGGDLVAGGTLYDDGAPRFGVARLADGSDTWSLQMPNMENYLYPWSTGPSEVRTLAERDGAVYFGGTFQAGSMMDMGQCLGRLDGPDEMALLGFFNAQVRTLALQGDVLVAGGPFTEVNFQDRPYVASVDLGAMGLDDAAARAPLALWPNPAVNELNVPVGPVPARSLVAVDAAGRTVLQAALLPADRQVLHIGALADGAYTVVLTDVNGGRRTGRFIKH